MPDQHDSPENESQTPPQPDVPASVTFMEMMRAAAYATNPPPPEPDPIVAATAPPVENTPEPPEAPPAQNTPQRDEAIAQERIRRIQRRKARQRRRTVGVLGGILRSFIVVFTAAGLMATIFTWWTPTEFLADEVLAELSLAQSVQRETLVPTPVPTPNWFKRIGIVSGHRGPQPNGILYDPGAVCPDGLTEAEINFSVAQLVVRALRDRGYSVDLLDEFDPRLDNYQAAALVSIHANTCQDYGESVSGYLVAAAAARVTARGNDDYLVDCISRYYAQSTGLSRHPGVTVDMTDYHTFREIHALTPAAILELGFMFSDRELLTQGQDIMAEGIVNGVMCFMDPNSQP